MRRLLIRPGGIGDCITCLPAMEQLRTEYTEVWVPTAVVPLIQFADRVRSISGTGLDLLGLDDGEPLPVHRDALSQFDSIFSWYGANRTEFRHAAARVNRHWQFLPALPPADSRLHATDFHAQNLGLPLGLVPRLVVDEPPRRQTIVIHPFSGGTGKNWPLERFRRLASQLPLEVEWVAGPEEELPEAHRFEDLMGLACWIRGTQIYVGNDSGITHLAAATGIKTVALFGAGTARVWQPRGKRVTLIEASAVEQIEVEEVLNAIRAMCDERSGPQE